MNRSFLFRWLFFFSLNVYVRPLLWHICTLFLSYTFWSDCFQLAINLSMRRILFVFTIFLYYANRSISSLSFFRSLLVGVRMCMRFCLCVWLNSAVASLRYISYTLRPSLLLHILSNQYQCMRSGPQRTQRTDLLGCLKCKCKCVCMNVHVRIHTLLLLLFSFSRTILHFVFFFASSSDCNAKYMCPWMCRWPFSTFA